MSKYEPAIGDIVRTGDGPTALMKIESFGTIFGKNNRAYGTHCMKGATAAYLPVKKATKDDLKTWEECNV